MCPATLRPQNCSLHHISTPHTSRAYYWFNMLFLQLQTGPLQILLLDKNESGIATS